MIRSAEARDGEALAELYNHYVINTVTTFETIPVVASEMANRVAQVQALGLPWIVMEEAGRLLGYACAVKWKQREAYRHSVESTIYLDADCPGQGYGSVLYGALLDQLDALGAHAILGGIALPNEPSVALHEKMGFVKVAHLSEVGRKFDRWIDVGYWQRLAVDRQLAE